MSDKRLIIKDEPLLGYYICSACGCHWLDKCSVDSYRPQLDLHVSRCPKCDYLDNEVPKHKMTDAMQSCINNHRNDDIFKDEGTLEDKTADIIFKNNGGEAFEETCRSDCRGPLVTCVNDLKDAVNYQPVKTTCSGEPFKPNPVDSMRITDPYEDVNLRETEDFNTWLRLTFKKDVCDLTEEQFKLYQETYMAFLMGFKEEKDG